MVTTVERHRATADGAGSHAEAFNLVPPPGRRTRLPELAVGGALMVGFALAAVLWHMSSTEKTPVLALAKAVDRGQVVEAADLRIVYISSDDPIAHIPERESASIVGRLALSDLPAGTLVTRGNVAPRVSVGPDDGVVGLALEPGQVPGELVPGDLVNVIAGPGEGGPEVGPGGRESAVVASAAEVYAVEKLRSQGRRIISLKLPEADANRVAAAAERGPLRLVLVGR